MWQVIMLNSICVLIVLGCLGIAAWALITGQIAEQGMDGLFLLFVCLSIALVFSFIPIQALRQGRIQALWQEWLRELLKRKEKDR